MYHLSPEIGFENMVPGIKNFNTTTSHLLNVSDNWDNGSNTGTFHFNLNQSTSNSNSNDTSHLNTFPVVESAT